MIRFSTQPSIGDVFTQCLSPFKRSVVRQQPRDSKLMKVKVYKFSLFDCSGAHLLKVPVIIGLKMQFSDINSFEIQTIKCVRKRHRTGWVLSEYPPCYSID